MKKLNTECIHLNCNKIHTRYKLEIIDTNYQCLNCGKILSIEQHQTIFADKPVVVY